MSKTFYDRSGAPVAYTDDGEHLFDFQGNPVAFVSTDSVYSFSGQHLGRFDDGWIRDNGGACVFFTDDAIGGPLRPLKQLKPLKGLKGLKPLKGLKELKPARPARLVGWSEKSSLDFFG